MSESDDLLLKKLATGDEQAFECLFVRHYPQVYRVLYGLMGMREAAEDLAQETFLTLYHRPPQSGTALAAWLCRVALNRGYNELRGERRARARIERAAQPVPQPDPPSEALRSEERTRVRVALSRLPERQRALLLLRHAGLAYTEIAEALELAPGSIGTLLARAERAFAATYEQMELSEREAHYR